MLDHNNFAKKGIKTFGFPTCFDKGFLERVSSMNNQEIQEKVGNQIQNQKKSDLSLLDFFTISGFEVIDKRDQGGVLWVVGTREELEKTVNEAGKIYKAFGTYCDGGRAVGYRKSWFTRCKK